jgi:hypothetical protein
LRIVEGYVFYPSTWDYVGAELKVVIGGGYTEFAGFPVAHQKTTGFLGVTTPPKIIPYYHLNHSIWSLSANKKASR